MKPLAVVAVGGNALTRPDQRGEHEEITANSADMAASLAALRAEGWRVAAVHGNGPQIGNLALQQDAAAPDVPGQPLHQLCAMTQGQLGSVLAREIDRRCGAGTAVAVVTHVEVVDRDDAAFTRPTKPIGPFLSAARARRAAHELGWHVTEDAGRGYRRVVPSPTPRQVVELRAILALLDAGHVVIAAGGGGIAVSRSEDGGLHGVDAVIDKDLAAAVLASAAGARDLYLLTGVDQVLLDLGTRHERPVHRLTVDEAARYLADGQFPPGSMGPKVAAALQFLDAGGHRAIITSARLLSAAARPEARVGTRIEPVATIVASQP
jgi:carbamate kinase